MVEVEWANAEHNIIRWRFSQPWTWDEFYSAKNQVDTMIDSVVGTVDSIFVTSNTQLLPPNATIHLRNIIAARHKRHNLIVIVGANRFLSTILTVMTRWVPGLDIQLRYATSVSDAFSLIQESRQKRQRSVTRPLPRFHAEP